MRSQRRETRNFPLKEGHLFIITARFGHDDPQLVGGWAQGRTRAKRFHEHAADGHSEF
jgi:hypothetical protein